MTPTRAAFSLAALAAWIVPSAGCLSSATIGGGTDGGGGATSSGGDSGGSGSDSGSPSGPIEAAATAMSASITPDPGGYVAPSSNSVGIQGAWYAYGDCWGSSAAPPGDCVTKGMHMTSQCSAITSPPPATAAGEGGSAAGFPQTTPGTMCLNGTAAQVIGTPPDYSNIFGIGMGLDFNNQNGAKMVWDAMANHVAGFSFHVSGVPSGGVRVEFPTTATDAMGSDSWSITAMADGDYIADLNTSTSDSHHLSPAFTSMGTQPTFDPSTVKSIQFHVATNTMAAIAVTNLCVSNLAAIVKM